MANSKNINIPLNVMFKGLTGESKGNLDEVTRQFSKALAQVAKPLGIKIDPKSIKTLKELESLISNLGVSIQRTGNQFTVMMQNASGMSAVAGFSAQQVKSGVNEGKTYFKKQSTSYSSPRLTPTQQLIRDYDNVIQATKELNKLEEKGLKGSEAWKTQEATLKRYNDELQVTTDEYQKQYKLKTKIDKDLGKEVLGGNGALATTQRKKEHQLKAVQDTHKSLMDKKSQDLLEVQETKEANQALRDYVSTSNDLLSAKQKLYQMETEGYYSKSYSKEEIETQKSYISTLENRKKAFETTAKSAEGYANVQEKIKNAEADLENTTRALIQQQAQRNIEDKTHQENTQRVNEYVSALKIQFKEEEKLVRLQEAKAPGKVIEAQKAVVAEATRQTNVLKQQVKGTKEYQEVKDKVTLAEKRHQQSLTQLTNTAQKSVGIFGQFKQTLKQVVSAGLSWKIFSAITQTLTSTTEVVIELDKSLVDLQIATGSTRQEAEQLLQTYNGMAKSLGATTSEVASAADAWLRQGYTTAQTNELIRSSMVLSKIGQIESAEATQYLTSALKGFNIEAEKSIEVVDKFAAVDLISATSASGLAEALSRTAASASMAGVEMEQLLGYVAVVGETTQKSMSSVGESKIIDALKVA